MTVYVEATSRCVWMSRLKHVSRTTTVTVRDKEFRRDGGIFARLVGGTILLDDPIFATTAPETCLPSNKTV